MADPSDANSSVAEEDGSLGGNPFYRVFLAVDAAGDQAAATAQSLILQSFRVRELYLVGAAEVLDRLLGTGDIRKHFKPVSLSGPGGHDPAFETVWRDFGAQDFILVRPGLLFPKQWDLRLAWTAQRVPGIATVSPICDRASHTALGCFDTVPDAAVNPPDIEFADCVCYHHSGFDVPEIESFLPDCVYVCRSASMAVAAQPTETGCSSFVERFLKTTQALRFPHVLADHVYVGSATGAGDGDPPPPASAREDAPRLDAASASLRALEYHARAYLAGRQAGLLPPVSSRAVPRQLHIMHSWGGGLERWVREYSEADPRHENFVLKSVGTWGAFGMELHLYRHVTDGEPIRKWRISPAIRSTELAHTGYRAALSEIIDEFGIERIIVSSLIGHSLEALSSPVRTVSVCHDYYPFCPALNITFDHLCQSCEEPRLADCTKENPHNRFFRNVPPLNWIALRQAFVQAVKQNQVTLVAPVESVRRNYIRLLPELEGSFCVIPHGTRPTGWKPVKPRTGGNRPLRILALGSLAPNKGLGLFREMKDALLEFAELSLVGCGAYGEEFKGVKGIHVIPEYRREDLPRILHGIRPDVGLLLSVTPETFSYTLQELLELGIPPLATRIGSFADRIQDGVNGLLCDPDARHIVQRLRELSKDRPVLREISSYLRAHPVRHTDEMLADYDELLAIPSPSARAYFSKDSRLAPGRNMAHCQLFWREKEASFTEGASVAMRFRLAPERQTIRLPIPALNGTLAQLRLDPLDQPGGILLHELRLYDSGQRFLWMWTGSSQVLASEYTQQLQFIDPPQNRPGALACAYGPDPFFILPVDQAALAPLKHGGALEIDLSGPIQEDFLRQVTAAYAEKDERARTLQRLSVEFAPSQARLQNMRERSNLLARQLRDLEAGLAQKDARIRDLGESAASLSRRVKELESSLSWRVTRPLRALGTVALKLRAFLVRSLRNG